MKRILIADDDSYVHEILAAVMSSEEFEIISAYDGLEARKLAEEEQPDLLVLDIMMPSGDGRDICRDLKNQPGTRDIKILMLSARDEQVDRVLGLEVGADEYIVKPFSPNHLLSKIKKMLRSE